MANPSNPNGSNQYHLDPRQKLCWELYVNPKSETFGSARASAIKAGYTEETANQITVANWFLVKSRRSTLFEKAEKVLEDMLTMPVETADIRGYSSNRGRNRNRRDGDEEDIGEDEYEPVLVVKTEPALVKIKQDTAKFVAERLGKNDGYSTRTELTGADGGAVEVNMEQKKKASDLLDELLGVTGEDEIEKAP